MQYFVVLRFLKVHNIIFWGNVLTSDKETIKKHKQPPCFLVISFWDYLMPCGMSARIDGLVSQLKKNGLYPEVISPNFYENPIRFSNREATIIRTLNLQWLRNTRTPENLIKLLGSAIFFTYSFLLICTKFLFEGRRRGLIVQYEDVFSAPPALLARILFNVTVIGDDVRLSYKDRKSRISWIEKVYDFVVVKNSDFIFTSFKLDYFMIKTNIKQKNVFFVPNGIKINPKNNEVSRDTSGILFVGQFGCYDNIKAVEDILHIARELEAYADVRFYLVGGPLTNIQKLIEKSPHKTKNVHFLGSVSQNQLDMLYQTKAIGLLPYFGTPEHTSQRIKALEFLSNGLLVVASPLAVDGFTGLSNGSHYMLAKTPDEMVSTIEEIISNYDKFAKVATNGCNFVLQNYSWDAVAKSYIKMVTKVISNNSYDVVTYPEL